MSVLALCALSNHLYAQTGIPPIRPRGADPNDPAQVDAAKQRKANRYLLEGRKLLDKNKIKQAKAKFKAVIGLVGLEGAGQSAFNGLMVIHQRGMESLGQARNLYQDGKYRDALKLAKECRVLYSNIWVGVEAASGAPNVSRRAVKLINRIETDPKARIAFQEYEASKRSKKIPRLEKQARKDSTRYLDLYKALKSISKRFPDCPTGKQCAEQLAELKADKKTWNLIKREERRRYIASALDDIKQFEKAGLRKEAEAVYRKLTKKYPGKSRKELQKMAKK